MRVMFYDDGTCSIRLISPYTSRNIESTYAIVEPEGQVFVEAQVEDAANG